MCDKYCISKASAEILLFPYLRSKEINIIAGRSYQIKIVPTQHVATEEFKSLTKEERRCRISSEILPESIFSSYSQESCIFECTLMHAVRVILGILCNYISEFKILQQKNCTPWDYPLPHGEDLAPLCTSYVDGMNHFNSLSSFNTAMEDMNVVDNCTKICQPSCEENT